MSSIAGKHATVTDQIQSRFIWLAGAFLFLFSLALSLAPAARLHSWQVEYRWNHWIGFLAWSVGVILVHKQLIRYAPQRDPLVFPIISLLSGWGLLTIWRLDAQFGLRQSIWLIACSLVLSAGLRLPGLLVLLRRYKYIWLTGGLLLTSLTFLFGTYPGGEGPRLWLGCCGIYLQPSEPLKLLLIVYLAAYLADRLPLTFSLPQLLTPTIIMIGIALAMLGVQRDLGTASLFIFIYSFVIYLASQRKRMLVVSLCVLIGAGFLGYLLFDVVRIRVDAWINPWLDPSGRSYQIVQSLLSVAAGGILGRGPGLGSPGVVPVAHSDFIFASISEETGLLGACALLGLFALLVHRGFHIALRAPNNYQRYLAGGISTHLAVQAIFIIGGNIRLLPLTGVTLPFVSYGGSSLLTAYIAVLILVFISNQNEEELAPLIRPKPYLVLSGGMLAGLFLLGLLSGWWMVIRSDNLLARTDNPRRGINDRYVIRGSILDRNNMPIARTTGNPGEYQRVYEYPPLGPIIGYSNPLYGQAGLEAGLDPYLRGIQGNPNSIIWIHHLLYGQPPPGLDVKLTLDLELQKAADELVGDHHGALVLLDASTGEIIAISSNPFYDANELVSAWPDLIRDPGSSLLNRATLGQYSPGTSIGAFFLAYEIGQGAIPSPPSNLTYTNSMGTWECAVEPRNPIDSGNLISSGCPSAIVALGEKIGAENIEGIYRTLGFTVTPELPMESTANQDATVQDASLAALGQENLRVTPLQMAIAAAALTNQGSRPEPQIISAVLTPLQGWMPFPAVPGTTTMLEKGAVKAMDALSVPETETWETTAVITNSETSLTWYLSGTLPRSTSRSFALALVLEEDLPLLAKEIGQSLLQTAKRQ